MPKRRRGQSRAKLMAFDSKFEKELYDGVLRDLSYHSDPIPYTIERRYYPDFLYNDMGTSITYLIEAKGRFWDSAEASKYVHIRAALPSSHRLVFLFQDPNKPMPHSRKRKDGTKQTHAEWAERNKFDYYTIDTIGRLIDD
jgi:hypothetical protein